jgi:hypothetical protein
VTTAGPPYDTERVHTNDRVIRLRGRQPDGLG